MLQRFAVVGNPVDHSLSPIIHQFFAKQTGLNLAYEKIKADMHSFSQLVHEFFTHQGQGLNVTLPFKQQAFILASQHSERCIKAGAANTLWMSQGRLQADNTDGIGLINDLKRYVSLEDKRVLILGAGGAARGIIYPLAQNCLRELVLSNRTFANALALKDDFPLLNCIEIDKLNGAFDLVINATSSSLTGDLIKLPSTCLDQTTICYDLAYNQQMNTPFVQYARSLGCTAVDGLGMLVEQAAESFFIWHGIRPETEELINLLRTKREVSQKSQ